MRVPIHRTRPHRTAPVLALGLLALATSCGDGGDDPEPAPPTVSDTDSSATTSLFLDLGKSFLEGGAGDAGSSFAGWALGQLGLSGTDETGAALAEIESTLQDIDAQLMQIAAEIQELIGDEVVANCQQLSSNLTSDLARIDNLLGTYDTIICTGNGTCPGGEPPSNVPLAELTNFVDQVLDLSNGGTNAMDMILDRINSALVGGTQGGIISACINPDIPGLAIPVEGAWNDATYYTRIHPVASFYYYYQTVGTLLYCEAQRFQAYLMAGMPDADQLDPDEIKDFLLTSTDPGVVFLMNETSTRMQKTWDNLRGQFNLVGAPYTNESLILRSSAANPRVYVLDPNAFTIAAGEDCTDLTTDHACDSILRGRYDLSPAPLAEVSYGGQKGHWTFADHYDLSNLMAGWSTGTAAQYLSLNNGTTTRGFENIDKLILLATAPQTATITLTWSGLGPPHSDWSFDYVPFVDTTLDHGTPGLNGHLPVDTSGAIQDQMQYEPVNGPSSYETFIGAADYATHGFQACQGVYTYNGSHGSMTWQEEPGWLSSNTGAPSTGFHLPMIYVNGLTPNQGLNPINAAGAPTMCTDDYEAWFAAIVPPPFP